ncbi:delta(8)-fatty-acid desaturase [Aspergillus udagawae]|nr:delta(8)-fatty-acid desaturase [Aspergillus udagawae]
MAPAMSRKNRVWSRREIEGLIADGQKIIILGDQILKVDAWLPYHPGGDKSMLHMVGRDATDEVTALHSKEAQTHMQKYVIGRVHGRWENFLPPIQGGIFRSLTSRDVDDEVLSAEEDLTSSGGSTPPSSVFDTDETRDEVRLRRAGNDTPISRVSSLSPSEPELGQFRSAEASTAHAISSDLSKYPPLDKRSQAEIATKYRQLDEKLQCEGLYDCPYGSYAVEFVRYSVLFTLFLTCLHHSYFALSGLFLGLLWHLLAFTVHDAGHLSITHGFHTDSCIGIFVADFLGGLSVGWWKRNHNVHHIVTNSPEHDPDIQHMPFFAISSRFFTSLRSSYYDRDMNFDATARFFIKYQHYLYYPILLFGRFNLYRLAWSYLLDPAQAPRKGAAWWHRYLEMAGQVVFWYWYGYRTLYLSIPTWPSRIVFLLISHMVTAPLHVQLTLSHFAMSSADLGIHESFAQKMVRTTMDVDCPPWLDFVHGGLNFQVVHHLFPRLPRHNLRQAHPYVKGFCRDVGIPYVVFGFTRGNKEIISRLGEVAEQLRVLEECRKVAAKDLIEGRHGH